MRKSLTIFAILMAVVLVGFTMANAAEEVIEATIQSKTEAVDTNGETYVRLICKFKRSLNGVDYEVSLPVMAFRDQVPEVAGLAEGATLKAVCQNRVWQGRESYTIIKVLQ